MWECDSIGMIWVSDCKNVIYQDQEQWRLGEKGMRKEGGRKNGKEIEFSCLRTNGGQKSTEQLPLQIMKTGKVAARSKDEATEREIVRVRERKIMLNPAKVGIIYPNS